MIPKRIIQVWMQGPLDSKIKNNIMKLNPGYEYLFFSEKECIDYIKTHYAESLLKTFENLTNLAHKCDLFRYCYLFKEGGIYIDADLEIKVSCDTIINESNSNFVSAIGAHSNNTFGECTNGFILAEPSNTIFLALIKFIALNPNPQDYGLYVKDLFNKLTPAQVYKSYVLGEKSFYLYREVKISGKYYIVDSNDNIIINTNGHNYL